MNRLAKLISGALMLGLVAVQSAGSEPLREGHAAYSRGDYVGAVRKIAPLAREGNARAQALLGFMYENGLGVPQAYDPAVDLYMRAAEQGDTAAQYSLGLMYDKGHGVVQDDVIAHKWLNLAAAHAPARQREYYLRLRNAVESKMTRAQIAEAQWLALEWVPKPHRANPSCCRSGGLVQ